MSARLSKNIHLANDLSRGTRDNRYNPYNFVAKADNSRENDYLIVLSKIAPETGIFTLLKPLHKELALNGGEF